MWSPNDWHVTPFMALRLSLGAKPYRCEYCRINFASFRRRREKFSFRRWDRKRRKDAVPQQQDGKQGGNFEGAFS
ncbi:MAG: hypothetical protein ACM3S5_13935 [Rhodospirillales bacterium]